MAVATNIAGGLASLDNPPLQVPVMRSSGDSPVLTTASYALDHEKLIAKLVSEASNDKPAVTFEEKPRGGYVGLKCTPGFFKAVVLHWLVLDFSRGRDNFDLVFRLDLSIRLG